MSILYLLIPLSLILVGIAVGLFIWAVKNEQFEDLDGPAHSILYDDDAHRIPPEAQPKDTHSKAERKPEPPAKGEEPHD